MLMKATLFREVSMTSKYLNRQELLQDDILKCFLREREMTSSMKFVCLTAKKLLPATAVKRLQMSTD